VITVMTEEYLDKVISVHMERFKKFFLASTFPYLRVY